MRAQAAIANNASAEVDTEQRDRLLALKLQNKERQRVLRRRLEKEKREVERLRAQRLSAELSDSNPLEMPPVPPMPPIPDNDADLTEFMIKPPPGLTDEELIAFQEEQDAELARLLQTNEIKKDALKNQLGLIESQDAEIARALQEKEKAKAKEKARKLKEKARARTSSKMVIESNINTEIHSYSDANGTTTIHLVEANAQRIESQPTPAAAASTPPKENPRPNFHNVAIDLDPTYKKQPSPPGSPDENGLHFARLCRVSPSASDDDHTPNSTLSNGDIGIDPTAASYLPVQGHRRHTPDKAKHKKKKNKENANGCKTQ